MSYLQFSNDWGKLIIIIILKNLRFLWALQENNYKIHVISE